MVKFIKILTFFLILIFVFYNVYVGVDDSKLVMYETKVNNKYYYQLDFTNDVLNFRNFKLKLGLFTSYNYYIKRVYIKYPENIKEKFSDKRYFSFDNSNFNDGIQRIKNEYSVLLRDKKLYDELEKNLDDVVIEKIDLYCELGALTKFKKKFPDVIVTELQ